MGVTPSRVCAECASPIKRDDAPTLNGREYCSSDCLLDAWEREQTKEWIQEFGANVETE